MSSSYRLELDRFLADLDVSAPRVLDIGGAQLPVKGRTKSWDVKEYFIADLPEPHVGSPTPDIELDMNYMKYSTLFVRTSQRLAYDLIFCLEVFDYVWNPVAGFNNLSLLLKEGGRAVVTFPTFYPTHNPIEDDALCYKEGGIKKLADNVGLEIVQMIKRRPESDTIEWLWRKERMRAAKNYDHNFTGFIVEFRN